MSGSLPPAPISRRLDRQTAMRILMALTRCSETGEGDVVKLTDREGLYRFRVGKWRVFFDLDSPGTARIQGIDNRGEAYESGGRGACSGNLSEVRHDPTRLVDFSMVGAVKCLAGNGRFLRSRCSVDQPS